MGYFHLLAGGALYDLLPVCLWDPQHWTEVNTEVGLLHLDLAGVKQLVQTVAPNVDVAEQLAHELALLPAHGAPEDIIPELGRQLGVDFSRRSLEGRVMAIFPGYFSVLQTVMTDK